MSERDELATQIQYRLIERLSLSELRYRRLVENLSDTVFECDAKGHLTFLNSSWQQTLGFSVEETLGHRLAEFLEAPADAEKLNSALLWREEFRFLNRERRQRWLQVSLRDLGGGRRIGSLHDVTEQRATEALLLETARELLAEKLRRDLILSGIGDGILVTDLKHRTILCNSRFREWLGVSKWGNKARPDLSVLLQNCEISQEDEARLISSEELRSFLLQVHSPIPRVLDITASNFLNDEGTLAGRVFIMRDVTWEQEVKRMKEDFIGTVSHELRTPLAAIRGYLQLMAEGITGPLNEVQQEFVETASRESDQLMRLINDLLDLSATERGGLQLSIERQDLVPLIAEIGEDRRATIESEGLQFVVNLPERPVWAEVDANRLRQVIYNLLQNAAKYTPTGEVTLWLTEVERGVEIAVRDTGIGLDPEEAERLFERFYRGQRAREAQVDGVGLGLSIVREIVELHGGEVWAQGQPGKGSTFSVYLPIRRPLAEVV